MGGENYPNRILSMAILNLLLISGMSMTMQRSVQNSKVKREVKPQTEMLKNVTGGEPYQCNLKSFRQAWSRSGCKTAYIPLTFCYGMCYSTSIPNLHNRLVKVCKPAKWAYQEVTAACFDNGKLVDIIKQVKKIHDCSCALISYK